MFIGHYAVAFASKRVAPQVSLGILFMSSLWIDLLWPVLLLLGIEQVGIVPGITKATPLDFIYYPFSHSLVAVVFWALSFGAVWFALLRSLKPAIVLAAVVLSHWFLDLIVHRPDLPLWLSGETRVGLGLWYSIPATLLVEGGLFFAGAAVYLSATRATDRTRQM